MLRQITTTALLLVATCSASADTIITQWNFNGVPPDTSAATGTVSPNIGSGTISRVGVSFTNPQFFSGDTVGGSSDPVFANPSTNTNDSALGITGFATTGPTANKARGIEFTVSTLGMENIKINWDQRNSEAAANTVVLQYLDSSSAYVDAGSFSFTNANWRNALSVNLSAVSAVANNAAATFRLVAAYPSGGNAFVGTVNTYATTGTWRFDMLTVSGTAIPPVTIVPLPPAALAGLSLMACLPLAKALRRKA